MESISIADFKDSTVTFSRYVPEGNFRFNGQLGLKNNASSRITSRINLKNNAEKFARKKRSCQLTKAYPSNKASFGSNISLAQPPTSTYSIPTTNIILLHLASIAKAAANRDSVLRLL
jgi:hypothetical protein